MNLEKNRRLAMQKMTKALLGLVLLVASAGTAWAQQSPTSPGTTPQWIEYDQTIESIDPGDYVILFREVNGSCTSNQAEFNVALKELPVATISSDVPENTVCAGSAVVLTANEADSYLWSTGETTRNITVYPTITTVYTATITKQGCASLPAEISIVVNPANEVSVQLSASATTICAGSSVTFTANPTNGGDKATYRWFKNGVAIANETSSSYTTSELVDGDAITVELTSNALCASGSPALSDVVAIQVNPEILPTVTIHESQNSVCEGTEITFTAMVDEGVTVSKYQWYVNGVEAGTNSNTFSSSTLNNGDVVTCQITPSGTCVNETPVLSNAITMVITPKISFTVNDLTACGDNLGTIELLGIDSEKEYEFKLVELNSLESKDAFIMEFDIPSNNYNLTIPLFNTDGYDFVIDWGDGNVSPRITTWNSSYLAHSYETAGAYQVKITGLCPRIYFYNSSNRNDLTKIVQWGNVGFTSFYSAFQGCTNLSYLPDGPITGATNVTDFTVCFHKNSLQTIPEDLFANCPNATTFYGTFYDNLLQEIPAKLFANNPNVNSFYFCFAYNPLKSIPKGLFDNCPRVNNFASCFYENLLTEIPEGLFDNCPDVTSFYFCFGYNPLKSLPDGLFDNCPNVSNFSFCFYRCSSLSGTAPELWLRPNGPTGTGCYCDCTLLTNYNQIPADWISSGFSFSSASSIARNVSKSIETKEVEWGVEQFEKDGFIHISLSDQFDRSLLPENNMTDSGNTDLLKSLMLSLNTSPSNSIEWQPYVGVIKDIIPGEFEIQIREKNSACVSDKVNFSIALKELPVVTISSDAPENTVCAGSAVVLTANEADSYLWSTGETTRSITVYPTITTVYTATITKQGCTSLPAEISIVVNPANEVSVLLSASATTICAGSSVTFTANPTNGGDKATYRWFKNGVAIANETSSTYTTNQLVDGDAITVELTSNAVCASGSPALSEALTIHVNSNQPVSVVLDADYTTICAGTSVTLTANPTNGGANPTYRWFKNGVAIANETSSTYTTNQLVDGDAITVELTSNALCASGSPALSESVTIHVNSNQPVSVVLDADYTTICAGSSVTFTANPTNGGANPTYRWFKNGVAIVNETSSTYTTSGLVDGDAITVELTSNALCASGSPALSEAVTIQVNSEILPTVTIHESQNSVCEGTEIIFTATVDEGVTVSKYQWYVNGVEAGTNSNTFSSSTLNNGDVVTCQITPTGTCVNETPVLSNAITLAITAQISFTANSAANCGTEKGGIVVKGLDPNKHYEYLLIPKNSKPVITMQGTSPVTIPVGSTYTDAGATATDAAFGDLTSSIVTVNNVNTAMAGTYTVTYNLSNSKGIAADEVVRTVVVELALPQQNWEEVTIGTQTWMAVNLDVDDGLGGIYAYDNDEGNAAIYGRLYTWEAAMRVAASIDGWHLPNDAEWTTLVDYLGGESAAGGKLKETGTTHWTSPNAGATNETGFTALPGGYRTGSGTFFNIGNYGSWWSAIESTATRARSRRVDYNYSNFYRSDFDKDFGISVRLIKDYSHTPNITLVGDNPVTISVGDTYTDAGATATDTRYGDITSDIVVVNNVNTSVAGTYTVTYNITTEDGYSAEEVVRTVIVEESSFTPEEVTIGTQTWMSVNLDVDDELGGIYAYNNNGALAAIYGRLYTWDAAMRVAASIDGWHLPSNAEWTTLITYLGGTSVAGGKLKEAGTTHWASHNAGATNESGFTALPGGRNTSISTFYNIGNIGFWWSDTELDATSAWAHTAYYNSSVVSRTSYSKGTGHSVRLIKDYSHTPNITLVGDNPVTISVGDTYTDAGATAYDTRYGDITSDIIVVNNVNTSVAGTYTVTYNITTEDGYSAEEVVRTVVVEESSFTPEEVTIGTQTWMTVNLDINDGLGGIYAYSNNEAYVAIYGRLYTWDAAIRVAASIDGWHLPSDAEWTTLMDYLGGLSVAGGKLKEAGTAHWLSPNTGATNETGFTALPGGIRHNNGSYVFVGNHGYWWSATEDSGSNAYNWYMLYNTKDLNRGSNDKNFVYSVRLIKDTPSSFSLNVTNGTGGGNYAAGTQVLIVANEAQPSYRFKEWTGDVQYLDDPTASSTNVTMPTENVSLSATYEQATPTYPEVTIGNQTWMLKNLDIDDGGGGIYTYNNNEANVATYGRLYTWDAAVRVANSIDGWHLPSDAEWTTLTTYLGGESVAGGKLKETGTTHWNSPNTGATNETGFTALPGGYLYRGNFYVIGSYGFWWSATETEAMSALTRRWGSSSSSVLRSSYSKELGYSVRLIKNTP